MSSEPMDTSDNQTGSNSNSNSGSNNTNDSPLHWSTPLKLCESTPECASGPTELSNWIYLPEIKNKNQRVDSNSTIDDVDPRTSSIGPALCAGGYPSALEHTTADHYAFLMAQAKFDVYVNLMQMNELKRFREYAGRISAYTNSETLDEGDGQHRPFTPEFIHFPILDGGIPSSESDYCNLIYGLLQRLKQGKRIYIHCWGGHGRTGTLITTLIPLIDRSFSMSDSLNACQSLHHCRSYNAQHRSPETSAQIAFATKVVALMRALPSNWTPTDSTFTVQHLAYTAVDPSTLLYLKSTKSTSGSSGSSSGLSSRRVQHMARLNAMQTPNNVSSSASSTATNSSSSAASSSSTFDTSVRAGGGNGVIIVDPFGTASTTQALSTLPSTPLMSPARRLSKEPMPITAAAAAAAAAEPVPGVLLQRRMAPVSRLSLPSSASSSSLSSSTTGIVPLPPFIFLTMNTLAQSLCDTKSFPNSLPQALTWEARKQLIIEELIGSNRGSTTAANDGAASSPSSLSSHSPSIICIQECDELKYHDWFVPQLASHYGYTQHSYLKKSAADSYDGVGLFVHPHRFLVAHQEQIHIAGKNQVVLFAQLIPINPHTPDHLPIVDGRRLYIVTTHLKAKEGFEYIRLKQVEYILQQLQIFIRKYHHSTTTTITAAASTTSNMTVDDHQNQQSSSSFSDLSNNPPHASLPFHLPSDAAIIFAGDFNDIPTSPAIQFISTGHEIPSLPLPSHATTQDLNTLSSSSLFSAASGIPRHHTTTTNISKSSPTAVVDDGRMEVSTPPPASSTSLPRALMIRSVSGSTNSTTSPILTSTNATINTGSNASPTSLQLNNTIPAASSATHPLPPLRHPFWFHSLYNRYYDPVAHQSLLSPSPHGPLPLYTTVKHRSTLVQRCIDYIFYSPHLLQPHSLLSLPTMEQLPRFLPDVHYPSDHLAISGQFSWIAEDRGQQQE